MKETTKKGYYHENIHDRKKVVKILDIIQHAHNKGPESTIVVFREVHPLLRASVAMNGWFLDFEFVFGTKKQYQSLEDFEEDFKWFVADAHTEARIREGFYDNN